MHANLWGYADLKINPPKSWIIQILDTGTESMFSFWPDEVITSAADICSSVCYLYFSVKDSAAEWCRLFIAVLSLEVAYSDRNFPADLN